MPFKKREKETRKIKLTFKKLQGCQ